MFRTIAWFFYFWVSLFVSLFSLAKVKKYDENGQVKEKEALVRKTSKNWSASLLRVAGVKVTVKGQENVPKDEAVLYVSNHQGNFDIPILIACVEGNKGFVAKKELEKLPIVTKWMNYLQCIFLDRDNPRASLRAINTGIQKLKEGHSLVIFPEGTRSENGEMGEFKPGSLRLATKSGVKIIPVTINGSHKIMKKDSWMIRPAQVEIIIHEPISPLEETGELTEKVYETIKKDIVSL